MILRDNYVIEIIDDTTSIEVLSDCLFDEVLLRVAELMRVSSATIHIWPRDYYYLEH